MIVVFEKGTNRFIGMAPQVFDNGTLRDFTLEELYPDLDPEKYGAIFVEDSARYHMAPNHWQFKLDQAGNPVGIEYRPRPSIHLSTDAPDTDGDGMPELKADGKSQATINIQLMSGQKQHRAAEEIKLSTTGGKLSKRVLTTTKTGKAKVTLTSIQETITITVTASGLKEDMHSDSLTFELMP
ncbi:MAG: Ig-like domain-containing protein [Bacteroidota bacterium]